MDIEQLKFPLGKFVWNGDTSPETFRRHAQNLRDFPQKLNAIAAHLTDRQLEQPYRPDGWTARQVIHHLADSHTQAVSRCRLALTENTPTVKPYAETLWANLPDARTAPIYPSLAIIMGTHERWADLLLALEPSQMVRTFFHPEQQRNIAIAEVVAMYDWHSNHHYAHIELAIKSIANS